MLGKILPYSCRRIELDPVRSMAGDVQGARTPNTELIESRDRALAEGLD